MADVATENVQSALSEEQILQEFSELKGVTGEIKASNRFILKRLNDLLQHNGDGTEACPLCKCQCTVDSHVGNKDIKKRFAEIEKRHDKQQREMKLLQDAVFELTHKLEIFLSNLDLDTGQLQQSQTNQNNVPETADKSSLEKSNSHLDKDVAKHADKNPKRAAAGASAQSDDIPNLSILPGQSSQHSSVKQEEKQTESEDKKYVVAVVHGIEHNNVKTKQYSSEESDVLSDVPQTPATNFDATQTEQYSSKQSDVADGPQDSVRDEDIEQNSSGKSNVTISPGASADINQKSEGAAKYGSSETSGDNERPAVSEPGDTAEDYQQKQAQTKTDKVKAQNGGSTEIVQTDVPTSDKAKKNLVVKTVKDKSGGKNSNPVLKSNIQSPKITKKQTGRGKEPPGSLGDLKKSDPPQTPVKSLKEKQEQSKSAGVLGPLKETVQEKPRGPITKPNIQMPKRADVEQEWEEPEMEKRFAPDEQYWHYLASVEQKEGLRQLRNEGGIVTVLCIDVSSSVRAAGAHTQIKKFFSEYISGLEDIKIQHNIDEEWVALVTFGNLSRVVQRLTQDFCKIRQAFGKIKYGGPSPMYGGLLLSVAVASSLSRGTPVVNGIPTFPKVVLITDGKPTNALLTEGPDDYQVGEQETVRNKVMEIVQQMGGQRMKIDCVCVGDCDKSLLESITEITRGRMFTSDEGKKLAKTTIHTLRAGSMSSLGGLGGVGGLGGLAGILDSRLQQLLALQGDMSPEDMKAISEIAERSKGDTGIELSESSTDKYYESDQSDLPCVGSRVRRGPDWHWDDQDGGGPGTIIGHEKDERSGYYTWLWVEWDNNGVKNRYHYSCEGGYQVILVEEQRQLKGELIATGCHVRRGVDWESGDEDGGPGSSGVVIRVKKDGKVHVRWTSGKKGVYRFGEGGKFDLEIFNPFEVNDDAKFPGSGFALAGGATGGSPAPTGSEGAGGQQAKKIPVSKNKNPVSKKMGGKI